ncbi:MAG: cytochrome d ubiquinol oxidase subunit II [Thermoleophilaceae bacterium]|nr:cytochrome d ubiquinol oxidase subunit II [Thermoleophilaceae bacterium]
MTEAQILIALLWIAVTAYALLGGADFGGGVLDLTARGERAERQRSAIRAAMGPVWEVNHVWLIYVVTGLFGAFPLAYQAISVVLFMPLMLAVVGIVMRGAAFAFRGHYDGTGAPRARLGRIFGVASVITPFFLGASAGALTSDQIRLGPDGFDFPGVLAIWTTPFALACGVLAVAISAYLAASYLTVEMDRRDETELAEDFRIRALRIGLAAGVISIATLAIGYAAVPEFHSDLPPGALALMAGGALAGIAAMLAQWRRLYRLARAFAAATVIGVLWGWALGQYPQLVGPDVTVASAAADPAMLTALLYAAAGGMALLIPSLYLLYVMFRREPAPIAE